MLQYLKLCNLFKISPLDKLSMNIFLLSSFFHTYLQYISTSNERPNTLFYTCICVFLHKSIGRYFVSLRRFCYYDRLKPKLLFSCTNVNLQNSISRCGMKSSCSHMVILLEYQHGNYCVHNLAGNQR